MKNAKAKSNLSRIAILICFSFLSFGLNLPSAYANFTAVLSVNSVAVSGASSSTTPVVLPVPSDNLVEASESLKVSLSGMVAGSIVNVTTNGASLIASPSSSINPVRSSDGQTTINSNIGTGTTFEFYAFVKTTSLSSVTVTVSGVSSTYFIKGTAGPSYNVTVDVSTTGYLSTIASIPMKVTDVFGNPVAGVIPSVSTINLTSTNPAATNVEGSTAVSLTYPNTPGRSAISISVPATAVSGLAAPKNTYNQFIDVVDLASALKKEQEDRAKEKAAFGVEIDSLKKSLTDAESAKKLTDENSTKLQQAVTSLQAEKVTSQAEIKKITEVLTQLQKKYRALVAKYNKLAKKFKQPRISG